MGLAIADYFLHQKAGKLEVFSDIAEPDEIPVSYLFRSYDEMPALEQKALDLSRGRVLDIGAGAGSHSLHLQHHTQVDALDISAQAMETAKKRGVKNTYAQDIFDYQRNNYDTLLLLMNGFGITGDYTQIKALFQVFDRLLNKGGQVLLDSSDIRYMFDEDSTLEADAQNINYYGSCTYVMQYKKTISDPFSWLFIDFDNLKKIALAHGYQCHKIMDGSHHDYLACLSK